MIKQHTFTLTTNPTEGDTFTWNPQEVLNEVFTVTFVASMTDQNTQCLIGPTEENTILNLQTYIYNFVENYKPEMQNALLYNSVSVNFNGNDWILTFNLLQNKTLRFNIESYSEVYDGDLIEYNITEYDGISSDVLKVKVKKTFSNTYDSLTYSLIGTDGYGYETLNNLNANLNIYLPTEFPTVDVTVQWASLTRLYLDIVTQGNLNYWSIFEIDNTTSGAITMNAPILVEDEYEVIQYFIPYTSPFNDVDDLLVRSSHLEQATDTLNFNNTKFTIRTWEGLLGSASTQPIKYQLTKNKLVPTQNKVYINLPPLLKEKMELDVLSYVNDIDYTNSKKLSAKESKWVTVDKENKYYSTSISNETKKYFILDGYFDSSENTIPNILMTGNTRYSHINAKNRVYFKTHNLTSISFISSLNNTPVTVAYDVLADSNINYVHSLPVYSEVGMEWIRYTFNYSIGGSQTVTFRYYNDCKYEPYYIVFKNKYGVGETLSVTKKSFDDLKLKTNNFERSIVDMNGDYILERHSNKTFNTIGEDEITLNTDNIPDYMNPTVKQFFMSDECWLVDSEGTISPIVKMDESISFKTQKNNKVVQYTFKVKKSHRTIKNIQ